MLRLLLYLSLERADYKLGVLRRDFLNGFLDDVIPVIVLNTLNNAWFELFDQRNLLVGEDMLQSLCAVSLSLHGGIAGNTPFGPHDTHKGSQTK